MVRLHHQHPNIGAAVSFHTHSGVILRPMGTQSDDDMTPEDLWMTSACPTSAPSSPATRPSASSTTSSTTPRKVITGTQDWVYEHLGALFWTVEIWAPNKEAGITEYDWIDWYRDHPVEDDLKLLKWSDEQCGGQAHVDWYPFRHPQLGMVELGGWDRLNYWRNPPPHLREREAARFPAWLMQIGLALPKLELLRAEVRNLGNDTWRVRFAVANSATCRLRDQARAGAQGGARHGVRAPPAAGPEPADRQANASRAPSWKAMRPRQFAAGLPAQPPDHRRPRRGRMGGARRRAAPAWR
jgi:hypothetical protein